MITVTLPWDPYQELLFVSSPMQGIILLGRVFTIALLYLGSKLFSFVRALQAIQYVRHPIVDPASYLVQQVPSWETRYLFTSQHFRLYSTQNPLGYLWEQFIIYGESSTYVYNPLPTIHYSDCTLWTAFKSAGWDIISSVGFMITV